MSQLLSLFIAVPMLSFLVTLFLNNRQERLIGVTVRFAKAFYLLASVLFAAWWGLNGGDILQYHVLTLYQSDHFLFAVQFYYDEVTMVFSIVGAILFFLVATFSKYYMHRDEGYKRFFNTILLFATGYNLIIFSGNFETLFIGWEIKGLCSFLLIAFYRKRYLPVKNAFKAVSYYRISDVALMLAMWMMHHLMQKNISFSELTDAKAAAMQTGQGLLAVFIVCMFILPAAIKSAQFPFTTWLPRAMEGPTSSSAIFYGSLSVHAGVFLLLRTYPFWEDMLWVKIVIIIIGALTGGLATMIARVQPTVKTQIAYASAAQIGLMFIEIALGFHWLVLIHFAGNAFLRTYQLLVSPSVLNYLVHHQYFHYTVPGQKRLSKIAATLYILNVKEWNLDNFMFRYIWSPFKWVGKVLKKIQVTAVILFILLISIATLIVGNLAIKIPAGLKESVPLILLSLSLGIILSAFASRKSALTAWISLLAAHFYIVAAILFNTGPIYFVEIVYYLGGVVVTFLLGYTCLVRIKSIDNDIALNRFHGYVYEKETTGLLFLLATVGVIGFPVTTAFIGVDIFFTYVHSDQFILITLLALCFVFIELTAFRILLRVFFGPYKKQNHPIAFRSS